MKRLTKIFFFFALLIVNFTLIIENSFAQWIPQYSGTNQNLYDVEFLNENTGWAVGDAGVIIKTTDGGKNWFNVPNPSLTISGNLWSVFPLDSNMIYVTSGSDLIMRTINGGANWDILKSRPPGGGTAYKDVFFLNHDTGWFLNTTHVLRTSDGFVTYDSIPIPTFAAHAIYFKDANTGIYSGDGVVFKSTDGGETWFDTNLPNNGVFHMFRKLAVVGDNVWVTSGIPVFKSTNFGNSWIRIDSLQSVGGSVGGWAIDFINELTGFAGGGMNKLSKTTDGGYNWYPQKTDSTSLAFISSIRFINENTGWYVCGVGRVYKTTTGGEWATSISQIGEEIPAEYNLYQNFPNPFNPTTNIKFQITKTGVVSLKVFDITGRESAILVNENLPAGKYNFQFSNDNYQLGSGVYFYTLSYDGKRLTKKFILTK